jgi:thiol-disulfide isomerase/thioredoxin
MISLQDKYYGLSVLSWLIILILIVLFYFTLPNPSDIYSFPSFSSSPSPSPSPSAQVKENFSQNQNQKVKVYNFNTKWCGYSVRFQPEWDIFQKEVNAKGNLVDVEAYDIKCDNPSFDQMCKKYDVPGFPTVIIEKGSDKKVYTGPRTAQSIIETVEKMI